MKSVLETSKSEIVWLTEDLDAYSGNERKVQCWQEKVWLLSNSTLHQISFYRYLAQ